MNNKIVSYADRVLPNQEFGSHMFTDEGSFVESIYFVLANYSQSYEACVQQFEVPGHIGFEEMTTPPSQLGFFNMLISLSGGKQVLEIGTYIGKSSVEFVKMVGPEGHVTTIESYHVFADMAERNFAQIGLADRVTLLRGDAGEVLKNLDGQFDFVFIDGSKQDYLDFTLQSISLLAPNGIIVVDDIFFHGDALNAKPTTLKGQGCKETLEYFRTYPNCRKTIVPAWNGILLLYAFDKTS